MSNKILHERNSLKSGSLYLVFKYVAIGSGIIGVGFLIALVGIFLT